MKLLRTVSTSRLLLLIVALAAVIAALGAVAVAATGPGAAPARQRLADAIHGSLAGTRPAGVTARITFTNNLFPSGLLSGRAGSALISGASGRLWAADDGRGRLELQSDAGDVQIVWRTSRITVFDASSNTVYRIKLPQRRRAPSQHERHGVLAVGEIQKLLHELGAHVAVSAAKPTDVAGRAAYSVRLSPRRHGGLLGGIEAAWDAARPVPLRLGVYAKGSSSPVLELGVTDISYGAVSDGALDVAPPASAKVVDLSGVARHARGGSGRDSKAITGYDAVQHAASFAVVAPPTLAGRARADIRLAGDGDSQTVVATYGKGLDSLVLLERKASGTNRLPAGLPQIAVGGVKAHELTTPLGTVVAWDRAGVSYVLAGSVRRSAAESALRDLG